MMIAAIHVPPVSLRRHLPAPCSTYPYPYPYHADPYCDPYSPWYDPSYCCWRYRAS